MGAVPFIVSVGNLAMGGTGKTPFTIFLADLFNAKGYKTAILSRGYKGGIGYGTNVIGDGAGHILLHPPLAADEPYMMARALPQTAVITGRDRNASYRLAIEKYNPSVFILDDAFQHRKMRRDLNIVLLDYAKPLSTGFPFPFGYLREFPSALSRADIIVFTRAISTEIPAKAQKYCAGKSVYFSEFVYNKFMFGDKELDTADLEGKKIWLMSGIAGNNQFANQMKGYAIHILGHSKFADHHSYTAKEIEKVREDAKDAGADMIICTQKDFVKLTKAAREHFAYPVLGINMLNSGLEQEVLAKASV